LHVTADDLALRNLTTAGTTSNQSPEAQDGTLTVAHPLGSKVGRSLRRNSTPYRFRSIDTPLGVSEVEQRLHWPHERSSAEWTPSEASIRASWQIYSRDSGGQSRPRLHIDWMTNNVPWEHSGGTAPLNEYTDGKLIISNPAGKASHLFAPGLIPLE